MRESSRLLRGHQRKSLLPDEEVPATWNATGDTCADFFMVSTRASVVELDLRSIHFTGNPQDSQSYVSSLENRARIKMRESRSPFVRRLGVLDEKSSFNGI